MESADSIRKVRSNKAGVRRLPAFLVKRLL